MRYPALESLRGLAALIVVIHHHLLTFPDIYPYPIGATGLVGWLMYSPLHLIWAGGEAVIFFFLLSGFVLSLGVWRGEPLNMQTFIVRRIWRIWLPFMVAVTLAWGLALLLGHQPLPQASIWFNNIWQAADAPAYLQHLLMLGKMDALNHSFIPVVWSLKWEMWLSLLLPLVLLVARQSTVLIVAICVLLLALYYGPTYGDSDTASNLARYFPMFIIGAWLARYHETIGAFVQRLSHPVLVSGLVLALLLFPVQWYGWSGSTSPPRLLGSDLSVMVASGLLIALALGWDQWRTWLERPTLTWLGRISFSLYLYHSLVLAVVVRAGANLLPLPALVLISFTLTFVVSHFAWKWVELPAMAQGKKMSRDHSVPST